MATFTALAAYGLPAASIWGFYALGRMRLRVRDHGILEETRDAGLTEPPSLHPVIDTSKCIGCRACALACPEGNIIGIVEDKAVLIEPTQCIGHGACASACPVGAIDLVFGTERRGMEIPWVDSDFETNVPGIYIAGELGGMGLIRNAVTQGREAVEAIVGKIAERPIDKGEMLDLFIVGAGPAGIAASLAATEAGLSFRTAEQDSLGGTVAHYPRGKIVMTAPVELPLYGTMGFRSIGKEQLIGLWEDVIAATGVAISYDERVEGIVPLAGGGFAVTTQAGTFRARNVLIAIGRRGSPRQLGVPGEDLAKVRYRLVEAEEHAGERALVVGGGDSALEAAIALAEVGVETAISYRGESFNRARRSNRERLEALEAQGRLRVLRMSEVMAIETGKVRVTTRNGVLTLPNDRVFICAGGVLPIPLLESVGIQIEQKFGTR